METARLPYTARNVWFAAIFSLVLAAYVLLISSISHTSRELAGTGRSTDGEAAGLVVIPLLFLALYTAPFCLHAWERALRRGSEPMAGWKLLLGLLPLLTLLLLWLLLVG